MPDRLGQADEPVRGRAPRSPSGLTATFTATSTAAGRCTAGSRSSRPIRTGSDLLLFYEYFHGDNGAGIGASHQTGWTGTVALLLELAGSVDLPDALVAVGE